MSFPTERSRPPAPQAQWIPMYQQPRSSNDGLYKPAVIAQTLELDSGEVPRFRKQTFRQKYFGGTKRTLRAFAIVAIIVLAINIGWLVYADSKYGIVDGYGTIKTSNCTSVKTLNTWFHFLINVLSTLLLMGSNAFMAAYSGPTRQEIDRAHARKRWLHVGSMSPRNIMGISWTKSVVVVLLALSSAPFHLLYNSLVYAQLAANPYSWALVTENFLTGAAFHVTYQQNYTLDDTGLPRQYLGEMQKSALSWEKLDSTACVHAYSSGFLSDRGDVVIVSSSTRSNNSVIRSGSVTVDLTAGNGDNLWMCLGTPNCTPNHVPNAATWEIASHPVAYCLSKPVEDNCSLKFSMPIMVVVVCFNALKVIAMVWILLRYDAEALLSCVGDAAMSFIKHQDQTTFGICLADRRNIMKYWVAPGPRIYNHSVRRRWGAAVSRTRWAWFTFLMLISWIAIFVPSVLALWMTKAYGIPLTPSGLASLGFGTLNEDALVFPSELSATISPIVLAIIANIPQIFLAVIYLVYMSLMTAVFNAMDWARFSRVPQTLMVSTPIGHQRGTWLLGAPIGYGVAILVLQTLLHWFVSESLFFVQLLVDDTPGNLQQNIGYSPTAIIATIITSGVLYLSAAIVMLVHVPRNAPPLVSTCSAAISAACHIPREMLSDDLVYEKLGWGATMDAPNGIGHCSLGPAKLFEAGIGCVGSPIPGKPYAGMQHETELSKKVQ